MAVHEPLTEVDSLSRNEKRFLNSYFGGFVNMSRHEMLLNVLISTHRPTNASESLFNGYLRLEKFHDREPELVVDRLESKYPGFFHALPGRGDTVTLVQKKRFVGRATKNLIKLSARQYGKPALRSSNQ